MTVACTLQDRIVPVKKKAATKPAANMAIVPVGSAHGGNQATGSGGGRGKRITHRVCALCMRSSSEPMSLNNTFFRLSLDHYEIIWVFFGTVFGSFSFCL